MHLIDDLLAIAHLMNEQNLQVCAPKPLNSASLQSAPRYYLDPMERVNQQCLNQFTEHF